MINPSYQSSVLQLNNFLEEGISRYSATRNFDNGPNDRTNVSFLSPFIRKRILHEKFVLESALNKFNYNKIEKFIQEVFWRTYWKGWLEGRKSVWEDYKSSLKKIKCNLSEVDSNNLKNVYEANTGIECLDCWIDELKNIGYLHNHSRMWFASLWIFTLKLPWELGADFFLKYLLDGDPASNTLSWKWVAGLQTQGKAYVAQENNIDKFTNHRFSQKNYCEKNIEIPIFKSYSYEGHSFSNDQISENDNFLINQNNLIYDQQFLNQIKKCNVLFFQLDQEIKFSQLVSKFNENAVDSYIEYLETKGVNVTKLNGKEKLNEFVSHSQQKKILTMYPAVGYELDSIKKIESETGIIFNFIYDEYDRMCWIHSKAGFFKFKSHIMKFLKDLNLINS